MFFYMSFADPELPTGTQFLGCTIVEADNPYAAMRKSWQLGINPGGSVKFAQLESVPEEAQDMIHRLVPRVEALERGRILEMTTLQDRLRAQTATVWKSREGTTELFPESTTAIPICVEAADVIADLIAALKSASHSFDRAYQQHPDNGEAEMIHEAAQAARRAIAKGAK